MEVERSTSAREIKGSVWHYFCSFHFHSLQRHKPEFFTIFNIFENLDLGTLELVSIVVVTTEHDTK